MPRAIDETTDAITGVTIQRNVDWTKDSLRDHLAAFRFDREVTTIDVDGLPVSTERGNERTTWMQLMQRAVADSGFVFRKKMAGQFYTLTASQILRCGAAGTNYIAACFAVEDQLLQQIDSAETAEALDAIADLIKNESTWPEKVYT